MRRFFRSVPGKVLLFLLCSISAILLSLCAAGAIFMIEEDFYTLSEGAIFDDAMSSMLRSSGDDYLLDIFWNDKPGVYQFSETGTNVLLQVVDVDGKIVGQSPSFEETGDSWSYSYDYLMEVSRDEEGHAYYVDVYDVYHPQEASIYAQNEDSEKEYFHYTIHYRFKVGFPSQDRYRLAYQAVHLAYGLRYWVYVLGILLGVLALVSFIGLLCVSGRRPEDQELHPGPLHKVPFDLLLGGWILAFGFTIFGIGDVFGRNTESFFLLLGALVVCFNLALGLSMSVACRIKDKSLFRNTVIAWLLHLSWRILRSLGHGCVAVFRGIPLVWRTGLVLLALCFLELFGLALFRFDTDMRFFAWFLEKLVLVPAVLWIALSLRRLQKSGEKLAEGDLSYHTDTRGMFWDFKRHGENLNSIASGMTIAVEDRLRSERMKTELITNVSHDIKTPLTSIINYAGLIGAEQTDNPKIQEYSEVLVRQSERLKRLIEDLVEASKASTGNLEVNLSPCEASVFLTQAAGEYSEKLEKANLELITKPGPESLRIQADGRRMWRIFDNLMNNICKYAQPGTRVYLSLEEQGNQAVITFKNTSREPLDMSEEELMERFVRGDRSRNTEGNGLGLSIARSMAELQGGTLRLSIDGDLFKAILTFPKL